jgi:hypothetical protein
MNVGFCIRLELGATAPISLIGNVPEEAARERKLLQGIKSLSQIATIE